MKKIGNWDAIQASNGYSRLPAGGYIVGIKNVIDVPEKEYLKIEFDIAQGEHKNKYQKEYDNDTRKEKQWPSAAVLYRSYSDKALSMFKGFITAVENSNGGYKWNWNEETLKNKLFGAIIGDEEYLNSNGQKRTRSRVVSVRSVSAIKSGDFTVPELKTLDENKVTVNNGSNRQPAPDFNAMFKNGDMFGEDDDDANAPWQ